MTKSYGSAKRLFEKLGIYLLFLTIQKVLIFSCFSDIYHKLCWLIFSRFAFLCIIFWIVSLISQKCHSSSEKHHFVAFCSNSPGMVQSCLWRHYHEKALPSNCTYLTSDLPFVPPRQQIAVVVMAGPSESNCHSCPRAWGIRGWVSLNQLA